MVNTENSRGLSGNMIKLIAIIAMSLDHLAWTLWPGYSRELPAVVMHIIGRITAPIMWYFIAEGYSHTRSKVRYAFRLFLLAFISHFAYNFCFGMPFVPLRTSVFNQTSVAWPLAWGLVLLCINDSRRVREWQKLALTLAVCFVTFPSDWSCIAAMSVLFIGSNRGNFRRQMRWMMLWSMIYSVVYFLFLDRLYGLLQLFTCLSVPVLKAYNGKRGSWKGMGRLFYIYYPAHLILCGLLRICIQ